jgi:hypothetical protein
VTVNLRCTVLLLLVLVVAAPSFAQVGQASKGVSGSAATALPEEYGAQEFPAWAQAVRRFEIVSLGAFPVLLFYSRIALDTGRYIGNGFDPGYAPWPFRNEYSYKPDSQEQWLAVKVAVGLSIAVGALDYYLLSRRKARQELRNDSGEGIKLRP